MGEFHRSRKKRTCTLGWTDSDSDSDSDSDAHAPTRLERHTTTPRTDDRAATVDRSIRLARAIESVGRVVSRTSCMRATSLRAWFVLRATRATTTRGSASAVTTTTTTTVATTTGGGGNGAVACAKRSGWTAVRGGRRVGIQNNARLTAACMRARATVKGGREEERAAKFGRGETVMRFASTSGDDEGMKMDVGEVRCTPKELEVFDTLLEAVEHFKLEVTLRVAGGWVRDKLLGRESDDIDIALDTMLGKEFAEKVNQYLEAKGVETKGIGVIQSNPEQSKHLETATMRVRDVWLDLVNLRSENYSEDSRIPEMEFGTAKDDAYRRDLTINALFYNINEKKVEDFTERGIEDLKRGVVRTPLPPRTTFLDDPLRILRAIRFAARFGFDVDCEIGASASNPDVQHALKNKVSRERFGKEVLGMLKGRSPADALALMLAFKISPIVLQVATQSVVDAVTESADALSLYTTRCVEEVLKEIGSDWLDEENKVWLYLAAWLQPYRRVQSEGKKGKSIPAVGDMVSNALKLRSKDADTTVHIHECMDLAESLLKKGDFSRLEAGLALRKMGPTWKSAVILQSLTDMPGIDASHVEKWAVDYSVHPADAPTDVIDKVQTGIKSVADKITAVETRITDLGLNQCWELKPPVTGQDVMAALNMTKGGPELKKWIDKSIEWILESPDISKEECIERIKQG